jgi:hypothetical protein
MPPVDIAADYCRAATPSIAMLIFFHAFADIARHFHISCPPAFRRISPLRRRHAFTPPATSRFHFRHADADSLRFRHDFAIAAIAAHYCRLAAFADASQRCWLLRFRRFATSLIIFADMIIS